MDLVSGMKRIQGIGPEEVYKFLGVEEDNGISEIIVKAR